MRPRPVGRDRLLCASVQHAGDIERMTALLRRGRTEFAIWMRDNVIEWGNAPQHIRSGLDSGALLFRRFPVAAEKSQKSKPDLSPIPEHAAAISPPSCVSVTASLR